VTGIVVRYSPLGPAYRRDPARAFDHVRVSITGTGSFSFARDIGPGG
jgi:hypothetical protein